MTPEQIETLATQIASNAVATMSERAYGRRRMLFEDASTVELVRGLLLRVPMGGSIVGGSEDAGTLDPGAGEQRPDAHDAMRRAMNGTSAKTEPRLPPAIQPPIIREATTPRDGDFLDAIERELKERADG